METARTAADHLLPVLNGIPDWLVTVALLGLSLLGAWIVNAFLFRLLTRLVAEQDLFWRSLVSRSRVPMRLALIIFALSFGATVAPLTHGQSQGIRHLLLICFIVLLALVAQSALHIWTTLHLRRFKLDTEDNLLARKHVTQSRILQRVARILIFIIATGWVLMTFEGVRQYGVSILASAGAAGIVLGLALQPVLKNLFAGIQLAITQPIRIDDAVIVEGEWGRIEEITSTYVVVRVWDWRRLIIPLSHFIEKPFQNWTREGASLIGVVLVYLDYSVPIGVLREKMNEVVRASSHWDGDVFTLQVTDFREHTMEVRILASARNAGVAFDLRCEIREELVNFLTEAYPESLPRFRAEIDASPPVAERRVARGGEAASAAGS